MRKIYDIHGGIHPLENKHQSLQVSSTPAGIPPQLFYPLSQHIGAPAKAVVSVGQKVLKGELLAAADGFISVPIHASTSGVITAIEPRPVPHPSAMPAPCIVLDSDGLDTWIEHSGVEDYTQLERSALLQLIRDSGIAGMGGAGFPAAVKLGVNPERGRINTLLINGTECEPYITADDILMREQAEAIIAGIHILTHLVEPTEILLGIEDNKPEAIAALRAAAAGTAIDIVVFPTKYPSGGEKQLIEIVTGKQVPSGGLPADIGIVCQNVGTIYAIYRAVTYGEPLISRMTTVTGNAAAHPRNYEVLLGTPMSWLLDLAGYDAKRNQRLMMGGPMMGFTITDPSVPVVKTTNCLLAPTVEELPAPDPAQACIRCGMCAEACPASLLPQQMYWFAQGKEFEKLEAHNLFDCIECGACSYVCPSNIPLVQYYRAAKAEIVQMRNDHAKSEHSRTRFEARQERLDREAAEKEAQRATRKAAAEQRARDAAAGDGVEDPVQAAIARAKAKKAGQAEPAASADPAQAAIEKAKATRAASADLAPEDKARQDLQKLRERAEKSRARLTESREAGAQDKVIEALDASVLKLDEKIATAVAAMADQGWSENPQQAPADPAQAAIERALAKRAAQAAAPALSPREQLQKNLQSVEKSLQKATAKLAEAEQENSDKVEVLQQSVQKLTTKQSQVQAELTALED
ncbi:electron transport complex subunit RsxC [Halieaceae bacterium IMCC14734]|uniref:Ion-translocating oxidoreductase complex subunit C n=1 Tax=Candidatus Litorirhabdus singularis TaxID=2518993 RepID=A0ABT3TNS6_9GAMM|nr:electron transport complex subunit RsxC [Candidatus Litorirhabdus singularis]MCX2982967.1 electron transport complex subunit RsxC [Candidatus Litorirhabdus singularis]